MLDEALALGRQYADEWVISFAHFALALADFEREDYEGAAARALAAREAADRSGDIWLHGGPLLVLGNVALVAGDRKRASQCFDESIVLLRRASDAWGLSIILLVAAGLRMVRQEFDQAQAQAAESFALCEALDDPRGTGTASTSTRACWPRAGTLTPPPGSGELQMPSWQP